MKTNPYWILHGEKLINEPHIANINSAIPYINRLLITNLTINFSFTETYYISVL